MTYHERNVASSGRRNGAGCMIMCNRTGRFLLSLRPDHSPEAGTWSLWGGKGESGEYPAMTAKREVFEETGFRFNGEIEHLHHMDARTFEYDTFLMVVDEEFEPGRTLESADFAWVPLDELPSPLHWGLEQLLADRTAVNIMTKSVERLSGRPCRFEDVYRG